MEGAPLPALRCVASRSTAASSLKIRSGSFFWRDATHRVFKKGGAAGEFKRNSYTIKWMYSLHRSPPPPQQHRLVVDHIIKCTHSKIAWFMRTRAYFYLNLNCTVAPKAYCSVSVYSRGSLGSIATWALTSYVILTSGLGLHSCKILKAILSSIALVFMFVNIIEKTTKNI